MHHAVSFLTHGQASRWVVQSHCHWTTQAALYSIYNATILGCLGPHSVTPGRASTLCVCLLSPLPWPPGRQPSWLLHLISHALSAWEMCEMCPFPVVSVSNLHRPNDRNMAVTSGIFQSCLTRACK